MLKKIINWYYSLITPNYDERMVVATALYKTVQHSTYGKVSHFYNAQGDRIRGWHKSDNRFHFDINPTAEYYNKK